MSIDRRDLLHSLLRSAAGGVIVAITTCASVGAHEYEAGNITVEHPWLRSPGDGETTAPLFMIIENKGDTPDKLIGARAAKVGKVVIHADPARIVVPHGIVIPPRATVTLEPGGRPYRLARRDEDEPGRLGLRAYADLRKGRRGDDRRLCRGARRQARA